MAPESVCQATKGLLSPRTINFLITLHPHLLPFATLPEGHSDLHTAFRYRVPIPHFDTAFRHRVLIPRFDTAFRHRVSMAFLFIKIGGGPGPDW